MRKLLLVTLIAGGLLCGRDALAQPPFPSSSGATITYSAVNPTGACTNGRLWWNTATDHLWLCDNGAWIDLVGAGGGVSYPLLAPAGTVTEPSYSWSGDTDNGIYSPFADAMDFVTGGDARLRIAGNTITMDGATGTKSMQMKYSQSGSPFGEIAMTANRILTVGIGGSNAALITIDGTSANGTIELGQAGSSPPTLIRVGAGGTLGTVTLGTTFNDGFQFPAIGITAIYSSGAIKSTFTSGAGQTVEFQLLTVADNGGGTAATATLTATNNVVKVVCNDADGCDITMGESAGSTYGTNLSRTVFIVNTSANVCNFADTAGVTELAGAFAMGQNDALTLLQLYSGSPQTWIEISRSNN